MDIRQYLDSTYLKTSEQAGISDEQTKEAVRQLVDEAIEEHFKCVMVRPEYVAMAKEIITSADAMVSVGTVIDFPNGTASIAEKLEEAKAVIENGADELDFVVNYDAFINEDTSLVKDEILHGTALAIENLKVIKWIIETAALSGQQIMQLCALIKNVVVTNFEEQHFSNIFVKSSTGFFKTVGEKPSGATVPDIAMMLENAAPLPVKASGGIKTYEDAVELIKLGVRRIGTSSAKAIATQQQSTSDY